MPIEKVQVVEVSELKLCSGIYDELADYYEVSNDSYHRYYPKERDGYLPNHIKDVVDKKLEELGIEFPKEEDTFFHVLLRFDW